MKIGIILAFALLTISLQANAHSAYSKGSKGKADSLESVEVGESCPKLTIPGFANSTNKEIALSDFQGKLLILDFWATWCGPCVKKLPETHKLQQQFKDQVQFILISQEKKHVIDEFFINLKRFRNISVDLLNVYDAGVLNKLFPHFLLPHYVWIDKNGKIIAITDGEQVNEATIKKVLREQPVQFKEKRDRVRKGTDEVAPFFNERIQKPILSNEGTFGSDQIKYKSVVTGYIDPNLTTRGGYFTGRVLEINCAPVDLYGMAFNFSFSDKMQPFYVNRLIVEMKNTERVMPPSRYYQYRQYDSVMTWYKNNSYVYDLVLPDYYKGPTVTKGSEHIRKMACEILKNDLNKLFPNIDAFVEERLVECIVLKCLDSTKVVSPEHYGESRELGGKMGAVFSHQNISFLVRGLKFWLQKFPPLVDETNYTGTVNLKIEGKLSDFDSVNEELSKFGLKLSKEKRKIKMLILKDREP